MGLLFFDTETSGLPKFKSALNDFTQPYVMQLAAIFTDMEGNEKASINLMINNGDIEVDTKALETHGITVEDTFNYGVSPQHALSIFAELSRKANLHVGHNLKFDIFLMDIMRVRFHPKGKKSKPIVSDYICTMRQATPILNLPPTDKMLAAGFNKPKAPNLGECYQYFFNKKLEGAHDALIDVRATKEIFFEMHKA